MYLSIINWDSYARIAVEKPWKQLGYVVTKPRRQPGPNTIYQRNYNSLIILL